jgi:hypothetical protein
MKRSRKEEGKKRGEEKKKRRREEEGKGRGKTYYQSILGKKPSTGCPFSHCDLSSLPATSMTPVRCFMALWRATLYRKYPVVQRSLCFSGRAAKVHSLLRLFCGLLLHLPHHCHQT